MGFLPTDLWLTALAGVWAILFLAVCFVENKADNLDPPKASSW